MLICFTVKHSGDSLRRNDLCVIFQVAIKIRRDRIVAMAKPLLDSLKGWHKNDADHGNEGVSVLLW